MNPSREKRHHLNAKALTQKTEGAVFQGKQMEVLGKASIWLLFKKNRILLFLFAGG